jgi:dTDP-4-amino-4,6-dideoxygalactose transaminase
VPIYKPLIDDDEIAAATEALRLGWLGMGSYVDDFERAVAKTIYADSRYVAAVSTGHAALHLGLLVAGVGPGDEVIVPSFTHLADLQAILAVGARPVLCDIEDSTLCLDPALAGELVGPWTRAILTTDYACHLCDYAGVQAVASAHGLRVVHDAAHSFGSRSPAGMVGSYSDICMFSFDPVKALSCVDAGVLVVQTADELQRIRELRVLGSTQPAEVTYRNDRVWRYDAVEVGFRYHLTNLHAAIGLAQLNKLDRIRACRANACRHYDIRLANAEVDCLSLPQADLSGLNPFLYYVRVADGRRDFLRHELARRGIETGIHWTPAHRMTLFRGCRASSLEVTDRVADEIVSLPLHSDMTTDVVDRVCDAIIDVLA